MKTKLPKLDYHFTFDFCLEKWYRAKKPDTVDIYCPFGFISDEVKEQLLDNGFDIKIKSQDARGSVYVMEIIK